MGFEDFVKKASENSGFGLYKKHKSKFMSFSPTFGLDNTFGATLGEFMSLPVDYVLEIYVKGSLKHTVAMPLNPNQVQYSRPANTVISHTLGALPVRQHTLNKTLNIEIKGKSGVQDRQGHDRTGNMINKPGTEICLEFDAFLDLYQHLASKRYSGYLTPYQMDFETSSLRPGVDDTFMIFRSFADKIFVRVEPTLWTIEQNTKNARFSYNWTLQLQAYGPAEKEKKLGVLGMIGKGVTAINNCIDAAQAVISACGLLATNTNKSLNSVRGIIHNAGQTVRTFTQAMLQYRDVGLYPKNVARDVNQLLRETTVLAAAMRRVQTDTNEFDMLREQTTLFSETMAGLTKAVGEVAGQYGTKIMGLTTGSSGYDNVAENGMYTYGGQSVTSPNTYSVPANFKETDYPADKKAKGILHKLGEGDTVEGLALFFYGDPKQAHQIISANLLIDHQTKKDGTLLKPGDVLLIPYQSSNPSFVEKEPGESLDFQSPFEEDLYIDPRTGDLQISGAEDVRTINGPGNLVQAIRHRVLTQQGSIPTFMTYGMPEYVGKKLLGNTLGHYASHLNEQLTQDPRIFEVTYVSVFDEGDTLSANVSVQPALGAEFDTIVPLD